MSKPRPNPRSSQKKQETNWLRMFWVSLVVLAAVSVGIIVFNSSNSIDQPLEASVPVEVNTVAGNYRNVQCKLNLVIDSRLAPALQERQGMLRAIVGEVLAEVYGPEEARPDPKQLPEKMRTAINEKLPAKLQVREVLIDRILYGLT